MTAHHSFPTADADKQKWLTRFARYSRAAQGPSDIDVTTIKDRLPVLSPEQDEAVLRKAGFADVELFYAAVSFRGWVALRP